jgi:hypothetical protein
MVAIVVKEFFKRGKQIAKWADNNMTKDEALKIAIEALEDYPYEHRTAKMDDALQACKQALKEKHHG